ncbi:MAG: Do family serine endopeptidase [Alphaproteobacteria bacterium]|nr:Do family serine endopeptidase [Alphaproteobacteria bacterium]
MRAFRVLAPALVILAACSPSGNSKAQVPLPAPTRAVPTSAAAIHLSFAPVVKKVAPAVVNISSKRLVRQQVDPFWQLFGIGAPRDQVVGSLGSGVIVRSDGIIVTNNHVIEGGQQITVSLADRREFPAHIMIADPRTDLAVLKIDVPHGQKLPALAINDTGDPQVGDLVLAVGDPFGVGQTVTNGIISALNRTADPSGDAASSYIQTDAPINPGNSGGPLVDMNGDIIGLNSFILSRSGQSAGVGFAIPAALIKRVVETAVGGGHSLVRAWLGARMQSVTPDIARSLGMAAPQGALVADIWPGSPAAQGGVKQGDVIVAVDGHPVDDAGGVNYAVSTHRIGDEIRLEVRRGAGTHQLTVRAEPPPASPARDQRVISGRNPLQGATVENLSPAVADQIGMDPFTTPGVVVTQGGGGLAAQAGFQAGDIIRAVNGRRVATVAQLAAALAAGSRVWQITIERQGQEITGTFQV